MGALGICINFIFGIGATATLTNSAPPSSPFIGGLGMAYAGAF